MNERREGGREGGRGGRQGRRCESSVAFLYKKEIYPETKANYTVTM